MRNIKIVLSYNGADFYGWQKQNGKRCVQSVLEDAIKSVTQETTIVEGSGRTDKGVHALGQVANFSLSCKIPLKNLKIALNDYLPNDIRILKVNEVSQDFNSRFSAKKKTYKYIVQVGGEKNAIKHNILSYYGYEVDIEKMRKSAKSLTGKHNFKGFCSAKTNVDNFEREIYDISISNHGRIFTFHVTGNGFLYNMVRIIVGTLLEIGSGRLNQDNVLKALESGERKYAGPTMSPCGLYLEKVEYEK